MQPWDRRYRRRGDLRFGLEADRDGPIAAAPELLPPAVQAPGLAGDVGVEVVHEGGELQGAGGAKQKMTVVGEEDEDADTDVIALGGPGQDAVDALVELAGWAKQHPAVECAAGDLDERTVGGEVAQRAGHARNRRNRRARSCWYRVALF